MTRKKHHNPHIVTIRCSCGKRLAEAPSGSAPRGTGGRVFVSTFDIKDDCVAAKCPACGAVCLMTHNAFVALVIRGEKEGGVAYLPMSPMSQHTWPAGMRDNRPKG